jgi:hypothetical protein
MGHAEVACGNDLVDRIARWLDHAVRDPAALNDAAPPVAALNDAAPPVAALNDAVLDDAASLDAALDDAAPPAPPHPAHRRRTTPNPAPAHRIPKPGFH